ncbi:hypothetical protein BV25DRAFT_1824271 [Artomyces pyxidatus]|uniref:Uncharacterized protein n=1 Tax=Artomyces pyxidatus TaxID=48021 RepID=A0ACB8T4D9_9AGAM|nr:hypothetical protein BV25DRAFT_1824271 [Artomyces pyxidatus]
MNFPDFTSPPHFSSAPDPATHQATIMHLYRSSALTATSTDQAASTPPPPKVIQDYLEDLTRLANTVASASACGSILAGQGSESDDFGDVGVWLGEGTFGAGHGDEVLKALKLQSWLDDGRKVHEEKLQSSTSLPATFKPTSSKDAEQLKNLLDKLQDKYYFFVDGGAELNGEVAYFLVGHLTIDGASGWAGLMGLGVAADY